MENGNDFLATLIAYIIIGAAIFSGIYVAEATDKQTEQIITTFNMPSDFREKTDAVLANIDPEISKRIISINVANSKEISNICQYLPNRKPLGCIIYNGKFGNLVSAKIFITNNYDDTCYTFEHVLYHEIGHLEEVYKYGHTATKGEDYANNFADQYTKYNCRR